MTGVETKESLQLGPVAPAHQGENTLVNFRLPGNDASGRFG